MIHMYRILLSIIAMGLAGSSAAALNVFACEPEWASLTRVLGGDQVEVVSATTAHQDPHRIEARPSLIAKVRRADLLVCSGAELEIGWLPMLQRQAGNRKVMPGQVGYFAAADQVGRLGIP
ncbi:MAG: zinc ABC transporter substrate-binding protein, partial [Candidatus Thiodiazotropha sp.]